MAKRSGRKRQSLSASIEPLELRRLLAQTLSGYVTVDTNANGLKDTGENNPILSAVVYTDTNKNGQLDSEEQQATPNSNGFWTMSLEPGQYSLRASFPADYIPSVPANFVRTVTVVSGTNIG